MDKQEILYYFDQFHPRRIEDVPFQWVKLGTGIFRESYLIEGLVVAKFPIQDYKLKHNIQHSVDDFDTCVRACSVGLFRYIPCFDYYNPETGVMLQKSYNTKFRFRNGEYRQFKSLVYDWFGYKHGIDKDQFGRDENGQLICFDWGHIGNNEKLEKWNKGEYLQN